MELWALFVACRAFVLAKLPDLPLVFVEYAVRDSNPEPTD